MRCAVRIDAARTQSNSMTNFPKVARQIVLKSRPAGIPQAENFDFAEATIPELADGQILVRNEYLSVDPAMRGWVSAVANYSTPVGIGEVMRSFASGKVVASKHKDYAEGESATGLIYSHSLHDALRFPPAEQQF